ncbi:MAG: tRNA lysidine(34) synthetase TilS [Prevotellaceae bacterium]|jgi:tRNA(Ile)-lysidine synthase|nr:tRNA lysidine(34) synthetase TilS [Prevotellaceae bacterium]
MALSAGMFQRFQSYCTTHRLYAAKSRWLVAVSGGVDSMTLAHLCHAAGLMMGVAHCNFGLRDEESDGDALFVEQWANAHGIPFFSARFDTKQYAATHGLSTQMAARKLRYEWFEETRRTHGFTDIAVAHHSDDNAETVLINLLRSTGIKGLCGMQPVNGRIIRPLLFATRREIMEYALQNHIAYREDRTNANNDYARNRIRHTIMPELQKINPAATANILATADNLLQACHVLATEKERIAATCCSRTDTDVRISIIALKAVPHYPFWLFELLQDYRFSGVVTNSIIAALDGQSGKRFYSVSHALIKDRGELIITPLSHMPTAHLPAIAERYIERNYRAITRPLLLRFDYRTIAADFVIPRNTNTACLAADKLLFPLLLRPWRKGDVFVPFGMNGYKKVSDFLIDEKVSLHEKAEQYVLVSGADIVWLVGRRIDERYKITPATDEALVVTLHTNYSFRLCSKKKYLQPRVLQ